MVAGFVAILTSFKTRSLVSTLFFMTHVEIINDENSPRLVNFLFIINNWLYNQGLTVSSQEETIKIDSQEWKQLKVPIDSETRR